ncbi:MAG: hypothetical protein KJ709_05365 [Nanoarchaeota archaeon]|nr:hypothetical protein [Nanoarchaeota archaeon]
MKLWIIEEKAKMLKIGLADIDKGFLTALQKELNSDNSITEVGLDFGHPLLKKTALFINGANPMGSLNKALQRMSKDNDNFLAAFKKLK